MHSADIPTAAGISFFICCSITSLHYWSHISAVIYGAKGGGYCETCKVCLYLSNFGVFPETGTGLQKEKALKLNREELQKYKEALEHAKNRYQIDDTVEQEDGSLVVHVRKQYTDKADVSEYFK